MMGLRNLLGNIGNIGVGVSPGTGGKASYSPLGAGNFALTGSITLTSKKWSTVGSYVITAQQRRRIGYGKTMEDPVVGITYLLMPDNSLASTTTVLDTLVRLKIEDANGIVKGYPINQVEAPTLSQSRTDRRIGFVTTENPVDAVKDDKLVIEAYNTTTADKTVTWNTVAACSIPTTLFSNA